MRPMHEATKDGAPILARTRSDLASTFARDDLKRWAARWIVIRHPGVTDRGEDFGWVMDAPVGHGGLPDEWFVGWEPLPNICITTN